MDKKQIKPKIKEYYDVKLEITAPCVLNYKILAESPEQALDLVLKNPLTNLREPPKPILSQMRKIKAKVFKFGTSLLELVKNF